MSQLWNKTAQPTIRQRSWWKLWRTIYFYDFPSSLNGKYLNSVDTQRLLPPAICESSSSPSAVKKIHCCAFYGGIEQKTVFIILIIPSLRSLPGNTLEKMPTGKISLMLHGYNHPSIVNTPPTLSRNIFIIFFST